MMVNNQVNIIKVTNIQQVQHESTTQSQQQMTYDNKKSIKCSQIQSSIPTITSALLQQSFIKFPYYFQHNERQRWIKQRQLMLINKENVKNNKNNDWKFIVVKMVHSFDNIGQHSDIIQTWVIDQAFNIIKTSNGELTYPQISYIKQKYKPDHKSKNSRLQFGKSSPSLYTNFININQQSVSNRHLTLSKRSNILQGDTNQQQIITFLLCVRHLRKINTKNKLQRYVSMLHNGQIHTIVKYIGNINKRNRYFMSDNLSKNGSYLCPSRPAYLNSPDRIFRISKTQGLFLRTIQILSSHRLHSIKSQVDRCISAQTISLLQNKGKQHQVHNRKLSLQTQYIKNVLILAAQSASCCKFNILYPTLQYALVRQKYQISIKQIGEQEYIAKQKKAKLQRCQEYPYQQMSQQQQQHYQQQSTKAVIQTDTYENDENMRGRIWFDGYKWVIKTKSIQDIDIKIKNNQDYEIRGKTYVKLGSKVRLIIQTDYQF